MTVERSRVLLTGATGFVGSNLARRFVSEHDVHIVVRAGSRMNRISDLLDRLTVHRGDLIDRHDTARIVHTVAPSVVVHLAAYGTTPPQNDVRHMVLGNVTSTINLVEACRGLAVRCVIATGSYTEYGAKDQAMREDDLLEPVSEYGVTKAAATLYCQQATHRLGVPITTLRLFTPYGPHEHAHRLVPTIIRAALAGERARLSRPDNVRDWIFIDDVVDAYIRIMECPQPGRVLNVATGVQASVADVVRVIQSLVPGTPDPIYDVHESRSFEVPRCVGDTGALRTVTGWAARHSVLHGLERTLAWWRGLGARCADDVDEIGHSVDSE